MRQTLELMNLKKPPPGPETQEKLKALWEKLDLQRFAPVGASERAGESRSLVDRLLELLREIDKEMRP
jgi:hypothetical protein